MSRAAEEWMTSILRCMRRRMEGTETIEKVNDQNMCSHKRAQKMSKNGCFDCERGNF